MTAARGIRRGRQEEEEESYFISMADMMVGLVFVFLILLLYFALQLNQAREQLTGANETRTKILRQLRRNLQDRGVPVTIDERTGVLRLPEDVLFDKGQAEFKPKGVEAVRKLEAALTKELPCYTYPRPARCLQSHDIDSIFIEGHTDTDALSGSGQFKGNLELSAARATNTFRLLLPAESRLAAMRNAKGKEAQPIFSVSGYGPDRPISDNAGADEEARKANNRRIELRFLMVTPSADGSAGR